MVLEPANFMQRLLSDIWKWLSKMWIFLAIIFVSTFLVGGTAFLVNIIGLLVLIAGIGIAVTYILLLLAQGIRKLLRLFIKPVITKEFANAIKDAQSTGMLMEVDDGTNAHGIFKDKVLYLMEKNERVMVGVSYIGYEDEAKRIESKIRGYWHGEIENNQAQEAIIINPRGEVRKALECIKKALS